MNLPACRECGLDNCPQCFECGEKATQVHHIISPRNGGRGTVLLCHDCYDFAVQFSEKKIRRGDLIKAGIQRRKNAGLRVGVNQKIDRTKVAELRAKGMSLRMIAQELGCGKSAVSKILSGLEAVF